LREGGDRLYLASGGGPQTAAAERSPGSFAGADRTPLPLAEPGLEQPAAVVGPLAGRGEVGEPVGGEAEMRPGARPAPLLAALDQPGADRNELDLAQAGMEMRLVHRHRGEPALPKKAAPPFAPVDRRTRDIAARRAVEGRMNPPDRDCAGPRPRAALFDVDGTLVDTNDLHAAAWREAFLKFGLDRPLAEIRWQVGKGGDNLIPALFPDLSADRREEIEDYRGDLFKRDYLPRATPFDGVRSLFERLAGDGVRIVLASSSHSEEVDFHLALIGCEDLVSATTSKDDVERSKPCPDIFEAALVKAAPFGAEETAVIGDTPWDAKAAARLGLRTIGFRSGGFPDSALAEAGACELYDGPEDLLRRYEASVFGRG
jgi:phosphoglycolate phosphatase-like HAD superfamily hydrolase